MLTDIYSAVCLILALGQEQQVCRIIFWYITMCMQEYTSYTNKRKHIKITS